MDALNDGQRRAGFAQTGLRLASRADVGEKFRDLQPPRIVAARVLPRGRFRRPHLGEHAVKGESLDPVAAAETFDVQLSGAPVDFEREEVFPFRAAHLQPRGLAGGGAEIEKGVVVHRHVPKARARVPLDAGEVAEEPAREINEMHALVDEFAAAGKRRIGAPLAVVADAPPVAVASANKHQRTKRARLVKAARLEERGVKAVIETHAHAHTGGTGGVDEFVRLLGGDRARLFDEDVLSGANRGERQRGERGIERADDYRVDRRIGQDARSVIGGRTGLG